MGTEKSPHRKSIPVPSCSQQIAIPIALSWSTPLMVIKEHCYYFVGDLLASEVDAEGRCVHSQHANTSVRAYELSLHTNTLVTCNVQCKNLYEFSHMCSVLQNVGQQERPSRRQPLSRVQNKQTRIVHFGCVFIPRRTVYVHDGTGLVRQSYSGSDLLRNHNKTL